MERFSFDGRVGRRGFLGASLASGFGVACLSGGHVRGQEIDVAPNTPPPPSVDDSLRAWQLDQDRATRDELRSLRTADDLAGYQARVRAEFLKVLGPWPERSPLQPRPAGKLERESYQVEKFVLESQPGFFVPVNLYVPRAAREHPLPAVLCPVGHAPAGKAHRERDSYQTLFITLARLGYVVLAFDPLGQGEREPYGAATGNHHHIQGYQCLASGRPLAQYFVWDAMRCLDYLASRPEVDARRIACVGCSGGGAVTQYLAAIDPRIAVAIPASWIIPSLNLTEDDGLHVESWLPRIAAVHSPGTIQLLACIAPRPTLILGNRDDVEFPPAAMRSIYEQACPIFALAGADERLAYVDTPTRHGFWPEARREVYRFLQQHLSDEVIDADESGVETEEEAALWCAPGGQVRNLTGARTVFDLNREHLSRLRRERARRRAEMAETVWRKTVFDSLRQLITPAERAAPPTATTQSARNAWHTQVTFLGEGRTRDVPYQRFRLDRPPYDATWLDVYEPPAGADSIVLVMADELERGATVCSGLRSAGQAVWLVHGLRGRDRRDVMVGRYRMLAWSEWLVAAARVHLSAGREPPRVTILLGIGPTASWAAQLAPLVDDLRVDAEVAAAAVDAPRHPATAKRFSSTSIVSLQGIARLESYCEEPTTYHSLLATPGLCQHFDEVDIASALAPRRIWIAGARDPRGRIVEEEALNRQFADALQFHGARGSRLRLTRTEPSVQDLIDW